MEFKHMRLVAGSGGAGASAVRRAAISPSGPRASDHGHLSLRWSAFRGQGRARRRRRNLRRRLRTSANGLETKLPNVTQIEIKKGEQIRGLDSSGAGYGDPLQRDPRRVLHDVIEKWETPQRARELYGVVFSGSIDDESLAVDVAATAALRDGRTAEPATAE
jgi:N-methylhydantoinase B